MKLNDYKSFVDELPSAWSEGLPVTFEQESPFAEGQLAAAHLVRTDKELTALINLRHALAQGVGEDFEYSLKQIAEWPGKRWGQELWLRDLIDCLRHDLARNGVPGPTVIRAHVGGIRAPNITDRNRDPYGTASDWVVFLNDDYLGGELYFPSRGAVIPPKAGWAIAWPSFIPAGFAPVDGYGRAFHLGGRAAYPRESPEDWADV